MEERPIFKPWVPQWLAIVTIIPILFPSLVIFALYYNSILAVAEYYSMDAMDIQYSVVELFWSGIGILWVYLVSGTRIHSLACDHE